MGAADVRAQIYRVNGELIPGTEGITPGPSVQLDQRELRFAQLASLDLSAANFAESDLTSADLSHRDCRLPGRIPNLDTSLSERSCFHVISSRPVLAEGELTGHQHRILDPLSAQLFRHGEELCLDIVEDFAQLVHNEHATIWLERGQYRVWRQREYSPEQFSSNGSRVVLD
jgi:hypothetical protein